MQRLAPERLELVARFHRAELEVAAAVGLERIDDLAGGGEVEVAVRLDDGHDVVVWYRRGNRGRGKGKGPPAKMVIHRTEDRVVFLSAPSEVLVDIDVRLKI